MEVIGIVNTYQESCERFKPKAVTTILLMFARYDSFKTAGVNSFLNYTYLEKLHFKNLKLLIGEKIIDRCTTQNCSILYVMR